MAQVEFYSKNGFGYNRTARIQPDRLQIPYLEIISSNNVAVAKAMIEQTGTR